MKSTQWEMITTTVRNRIRSDLALLTENQWKAKRYVPVDDESGKILWPNQNCQRAARYLFEDEVRRMTFEEEDEYRNELREKRNKRKEKNNLSKKLDDLQYHIELLSNDCIYMMYKLVQSKLQNVKAVNKLPVVLDVETTGLENTDELLQVSIIDINGKILFNSYIKPVFHDSWTQAKTINHINLEMVREAPELWEVAKDISAAIKEAPEIIGYNVSYDIELLDRFGIYINKNAQITDVMEKFAPIYGEWSDSYGCFRWQKLVTCAAYYNYDWQNVKAHDSLADCLATLFCYKKIIEEDKKNEQV